MPAGMLAFEKAIEQGVDSIELDEHLSADQKIEINSVQIQKTEKERIKLEFDVIYPPKMDKPALFCMMAENNEILSVGE